MTPTEQIVSPEIKILNTSCSRPQQLSTYALTLYKHTATVGNKTVAVGMCRTVHLILFGSVTTCFYPAVLPFTCKT